VLRDCAFAPAGSTARSLTLAELLALPAVTDLVTAGKALGIGRSASYELAPGGQVPVPGHPGREELPGPHRRPAHAAGHARPVPALAANPSECQRPIRPRTRRPVGSDS